MSLLEQYRASLKPLEVEETIDVFVHRPLGYLVARMAYPMRFLSANLLTLLSILVGVASGAILLTSAKFCMQISGALLFFSAVLDCADGQLARMRRSSSVFGRMLDGTADLITVSVVAPATLYVVWRTHNTPLWLGVTVLTLGIATMVTSSFHTGMYDHFKNVYLRLTSEQYEEGEDYETAVQRWHATRTSLSWWKRISWWIYLFYVRTQRNYVLGFDPYSSARLNLFPAYDPKRAEIYRRHAGPLMRVWRRYFGFGSMVFGLAFFNAIERADLYLVLRLVVLNAIFYAYLRPAQRRASRAAFREMNLQLPDQPIDPTS